MVGWPQIALLVIAAMAYAAGGAAAVVDVMGRRTPRGARAVCLGLGMAMSAGVLIWHAQRVVSETGSWWPMQDNLSALLTLSVVLAGFVTYVQARHPIAWLEWLVMPVVLALLLMAGHFGTTKPQAYLPGAYSLMHRVSIFSGTLAFLLAGAMGGLYLITDWNLRQRPKWGGPKSAPVRPMMFSSLERLEKLIYTAVTFGFALFSIGVVTGVVWAVHAGHTRLGERWYLVPKVFLALAAWVVFAVVLHTPIAPRLRGKKNAILSIVGLLLTLAALLAALLFMPTGGAS